MEVIKKSIGIKEGCPGLSAALLLQVIFLATEIAREKIHTIRDPVGNTSDFQYPKIIGNAKSQKV